jgi:hypothetical protein
MSEVLKMDNMKFYDKLRTVPQNALKPITAGRLKGFSDINPMWRIKALTEVFGACGFGWWYEITDKQLVPDEASKQVAAFMDILLYVKDPESGEVSRGIPGTGGSSFVAQERNGAYMSDECFKMALTDAISVAAKALGMAADVYYEKDRSKYDRLPAGDTTPAFPPVCECCGKTVKKVMYQGDEMSATDFAKYTKSQYGRVLCVRCMSDVEAGK